MPLTPGESLVDKYRIIEMIGEGSMARVWLAEETAHAGRHVAIKEPLSDLTPAAQSELERRFCQEISLSAQLMDAGATHVVRVWTVERHEDDLLLVMPYLAGGSLADMLRANPEGLPIADVVRITDDLLAALERFHDLPSDPVHRDIKPSNILLDEGGQAYLTDFGLAQLTGESGRSQLMGGSHPSDPLYSAPEQLRMPDPLLPAADIYALGCVVFEMLTGRPYRSQPPGTPARTLRPDAPDWLDDMLAKALQEKTWERWRRAGEWREALWRHAPDMANATREPERSDAAPHIRQTKEDMMNTEQQNTSRDTRETSRAHSAQEPSAPPPLPPRKRKLDTRSIALVGIMVAVTCVFTLLIRIPVAPTRGYIHLGDVAANFGALAFGPWLGLIIAGGGTALADLLGGYPNWAPLTFVIHGLQGFVVGYLAYLGRHRIHTMVIGAVLGEIIVVLGYFLVEIPLYGLGPALTELPGNAIQGLFGLLGVPLLIMVARAYPPLLLHGGPRVGSDNDR
jgi:serine/threonine protein kinase